MLVSDCRNVKSSQHCSLDMALKNYLQPLLYQYYQKQKSVFLKQSILQFGLISSCELKKGTHDDKMKRLQLRFWKDLILIVGNPHETEQEIMKKKHPLDILEYFATSSKKEILHYLLQLSVYRTSMEISQLCSK